MDFYTSAQSGNHYSLSAFGPFMCQRLPNLPTTRDSYETHSLANVDIPSINSGVAHLRGTATGRRVHFQETSEATMPPIKPVTAMCFQITPEQWRRANHVTYRRSDASRQRSELLRLDADRLIKSSEQLLRKRQGEVDKRASERTADLAFWSKERLDELERLVQEIECLRKVKVRLDTAIIDTELPLQIARECLSKRQKRPGPDLVEDHVEQALHQEVSVIQCCQDELRRGKDKVKKQLDRSRRAQLVLEQDVSAKHKESQCHQFNSSTSLPDQSASTPGSWAQVTEQNLLQSQSERIQTQQLSKEVQVLLESTQTTIRCQGDKVDEAFVSRVAQTTQTKEKLQDHLAKTLEEMYQIDVTRVELERAIATKRAPLRVSAGRQEERSMSPGKGLSRLFSDGGLIEDTLSALKQRLSESHQALQQLEETKQVLEGELFNKANALYIDQDRCVGLRRKRPPATPSARPDSGSHTHTHTCRI